MSTQLDDLRVAFPSTLPPLDGGLDGVLADAHIDLTASGSTLRPPTDFDEFARLVAVLLEADPTGWEPDTVLAELGWDSLTMIELLGAVDRMGVHFPEELLGAIRTLGDVHAWALGAAASPAAPAHHDPFRGPNVFIQPVTARDEEWIFRLYTTGEHLSRYRLRANTPSPETFHRFLWERVLAQFLVCTHDGKPVGLVSCFDVDQRNRFAHLAAVAAPEWESSGLVLEGMTLLISYVFANWDLRKLYAETLESNYEQFRSGADRVFDVEGRLKAHEYRAGRYEDMVVLALHRDAWARHHERILGTPPPF
jgi:RimJ/RimL family protein N-acetyltransferase/acyl carrier protein